MGIVPVKSFYVEALRSYNLITYILENVKSLWSCMTSKWAQRLFREGYDLGNYMKRLARCVDRQDNRYCNIQSKIWRFISFVCKPRLFFSLISGSRAVIAGARIGRFGLLPTTLHRIGVKSTTVKSASKSVSHREAEVERKNVIADYLRVI